MIGKIIPCAVILWFMITCSGCNTIPNIPQVKKNEAEDTCSACHKGTVQKMPAEHPDVEDPDEELCARIRTIFDDVQTGEFLSAFHAKQDISCRACHGDEMPELDAEVDNETCFACHGSYEVLAELTRNAVVAEQNPHKSHLGNVDCSVCHHAHSRSRSYCLECHSDFNMPMPGQK